MNKQDKIKELQAEIEKLEAEIESGAWWPSDEEKAYHINDFDEDDYVSNIDCFKSASRATASGLFKTLEEAETWRKVNNRYYELMKDVKLDWNDGTYDKKLLFFDHQYDEVMISSSNEQQSQGVSYMTHEVAERLLKDFTQDQLKIWVLGGARR